jgi:PQQ-dependent dehydrogenase (methanol/ethanol family)
MTRTGLRALLRGAAAAALFAGTAVLWAGLATSEELEQPAPPPARATGPQLTFQMHPIHADVTNSESDRINADADVDNWRLHGRTYDNQRFSPLTQVNKSNVRQLKPVALIQTGVANSLEMTAIVINGIMFIETASNIVQAYDAVTGDELWSYTPVLEYSDLCCGPQSRGVAVANGKVFISQVDGHVVALDAKTGRQLWKTVNAELLPQPTHWYSFTGSPQVYNGLVMVGNGGAEWPTRGFYAALDENTGKLVWRFWDTAGPDDPNFKGAWEGDSWKIGGGSIWDAAAIDPKRDIAVVAVGNPNPDLYGENRKGNNLYTAAIVGLNAKTGKVAWYYQQIPHDVWDLDSAAPVMLFDTIDAKGKPVAAAAQAQKDGFLYIVNRDNGKLIRRSEAFVLQNKESWRVPPDGTARVYYPGNHGGAMWQPPAFSPVTRNFYTMGINQPSVYKALASKPWVPGSPAVGQQFGNAPVSAADRAALQKDMVPNSGNITAINVDTGKVTWQYPSDHLMFGGVLATAGGLVFSGEVAGNFMAFDAATGEKLWSYHLGIGVCTPPITYRVKGIQYVAVGASGCHSQESQMKREGRPIFGNTIAIFALPDAKGG